VMAARPTAGHHQGTDRIASGTEGSYSPVSSQITGLRNTFGKVSP